MLNYWWEVLFVMAEPIRYSVACCQTDLPSPSHRHEIGSNVTQMLKLVDHALAGYKPFLPVRLVVFPEFAHSPPIYSTVAELQEKLGVPIPNEFTDRYIKKANENGIYIQTGSFLEMDASYPGAIFNTTCLIGPQGILHRYRKVQPWIPLEVHTSPHDIEGYSDELFPVTKTEIGKLGVATCYDWLFPETTRQLTANGAEVLIRISAYMDPWGSTTPMDWWTVINRARAIENVAQVVACNQGASLSHYPPFSWPGGSMIVDFNGRILSQADPGPGEKIVVADIDITALRHERATRKGHQCFAHLRTEAYPLYSGTVYPKAGVERLSIERNEKSIEETKGKLGYGSSGE